MPLKNFYEILKQKIRGLYNLIDLYLSAPYIDEEGRWCDQYRDKSPKINPQKNPLDH